MADKTVDVLAVLDREISARQLASSGHAVACVEHPPGSAFPCSCNGPQLVATRAAIAELMEHDKALREALGTCERWFTKHSPTAPLIGDQGEAEHPMLTMLRAALRAVGGAE